MGDAEKRAVTPETIGTEAVELVLHDMREPTGRGAAAIIAGWVAAAIRAAVLAERERCKAVVREAVQRHYGYSGEVIADEIERGRRCPT